MAFNRYTDASDWRVRVYDKKDKVIKSWIIKDRLESEAENEAASDVAREGSKVADWTMTRIVPRKVKNTK